MAARKELFERTKSEAAAARKAVSFIIVLPRKSRRQIMLLPLFPHITEF